jgi:hypothetical protein
MRAGKSDSVHLCVLCGKDLLRDTLVRKGINDEPT